MKKYVWPTLMVVALVVGFLLGNALCSRVQAQRRFVISNGQIWASPTSKVEQMLQMMQEAYVDSLDTDSVTEVVMQELVQKLDPHSSYIPKKDLELVNSELSASFSGIGVQFSIQQDTVSIVAVIPGGPSQGVGLLAGDRIVMVDDSAFVGKGLNNERVMRKLRGEKGTQVRLGVVRRGTPEMLHYTVTRGDIPVNSVDAKFIIPTAKGKIGFVRVNKFGESTYREFISALAELRAQGADRFIVDLRENSGGFMDQSIRMANEFLSRGDGIVAAEGRRYRRMDYHADGSGRFRNEKMVVLIDGFSASASEIFAGAMQDNDRATIIGRRSFGKGLVMQQFPFADGSAVRLTVARYYTPSGRCIQKPYTMGDQEGYEKELFERFEHGELYSADSIHVQDSTIYRTKGGRIVYGGGGILPDIFVARDTTQLSPWFNRVCNMAYTYQFAYGYTDRHRAELSRFKDWQSLEKHLLAANWVPEFVAFCKEKGVEPNPEQIAKSRPALVRLVNAYIVRDMLGDAGFFPLFERDDEMTKKAVDYLVQH